MQLANENEILAEIGRIISSTVDINEVYQQFSEQVRHLIPFDRIVITTVDVEQDTTTREYILGTDVPPYVQGIAFPLENQWEISRTRSSMLFQTQDREEVSDRFPETLQFFDAGLRSFLWVPMIAHDEIIGVLYLSAKKANAYTWREVALAERVGEQIAGAVATSQLFAEVQRAKIESQQLAEENEILAEIGRIISSSADIDEVYQQFAEQVRHLIPFDRTAIWTIDAARDSVTISYVAGTEVPDRGLGAPVPLAGTVAAEVIRRRTSVLVRSEDMEEFLIRHPGARARSAEMGLQTLLLVPLIAHDEPIGVLYLGSMMGDTYDDRHVALGERVADQIAGAIANARLSAERQRAEIKARRLADENESLAEIGRIISSSADVNEVYDLFAEQLRRLVPFERIVVSTVDIAQDTMTIECVIGMEISDRRPGGPFSLAGTVAAEVVHRGTSVLFHPKDIEEFSSRYPGASVRFFEAGLRSFLSVPLIARDDLIGVFYLGSNKVDAYSQRHVALAERIGRQIAGTVAVAHLYAESVQMRSNMEASRARFAGILDIAADAVISVDQMQQITLFNQGAEQIFGYSAREVIGQPLNCLIPERSRTVHSQLLTQFIDDPDSSRMMGERREVFGLRKGDIEFPAEASISKMEFDGDVVLTVMMRDITHRKRAEEALTASNERLMSVLDNLRDAQKQLVQQERLSALGTMASGIAHDFNNALTPILGYTDMLLNRPVLLDDRDKLTRYLQETNTAARDASEVVSRMREFYRHREDVDLMGAADLNKVVEEAVGVTQHRWKDMTQSTGVDIDIGTELSEDLPFVAGNEASLRSALTNLILNAVDAMPVGGTLTISTRSAEESVELRVSDTGTGMTEDVRRRAMEPFFTTKAEGGSGLGLAMVHGIVERHGGQIDIQSELGKGTTFVVKLPTTTALGETATPSDDTQAVRGRHVLVVDDEEFILNLVTEYLGASGNSVETATNGWEALEMFKAGKFDVVITDRGMPGMNGDQLAIAIKELASDIPVIMVTGVGEVMAVTNETPAGVDLVVNKPVTESDLQKAMSQVLGEES